MDEELQGILLECAKAQYCGELVHFLVNICKVMPHLKYTDNCSGGGMLAIIDKYVRTKQATSLNIESELRLRVLFCASILNEEISKLNHSSVLNIPQMTKSSTSLGKVSVASKTTNGYTEVGLSQPPDARSDAENTDSVTGAQDNLCAKSTTSATSNSSALSIRDEDCSNLNMSTTYHILTIQTEISHEVPVGRKKSTEDVESVDGQSFTPQPKDLKNPQVRCSSKAAYNLGKALEETAVSVCVLLRFSGVLEATKKDPRFVEITQRRARLAKNNMVKIL
ncbi:hypothetical protein SARC_04205 [Sphaeroforma arctica JP610]|uniref:Uncharacterized protein n=1 Tax=Sphaeroforma arctica JP610 TaxID=667725 RepID=A0A0L0G5N8_9EUKA|nr:hypothetical protein SARC_04205 [Sphaeroforma arctica JP610]KNC83558.1 hypothetical protein SARC_04205 [Sphaeroforma arctica JP610]|eukprot:XP_014157460.1 hypothetical protein SARC_04205 [Sphaeroforma arctica JP610]